MKEVAVHATRAVIYMFDKGTNAWEEKSSGLADVWITQLSRTGEFRVAGRGQESGKWCLNGYVYATLTVQKVSGTFVQWQDEQKIYGLSFSEGAHASSFVKALTIVIHTVRSRPKPSQQQMLAPAGIRRAGGRPQSMIISPRKNSVDDSVLLQPTTSAPHGGRRRGATQLPPPKAMQSYSSGLTAGSSGSNRKSGNKFFTLGKSSAKQRASASVLGDAHSEDSHNSFNTEDSQSTLGSLGSEDDLGKQSSSPRGARRSKADLVAKADPLKVKPPKPASHRDRAAFEIFTTEQSYVHNLFAICDEVLKPLRAQNILTEHEVKRIFCNVETIRSLNYNFLVDLLPRIQEWNDQQKLGDRFRRIIPFFRVYIDYYKNYESVPGAIDDFTARKPFARWLKTPKVEAATSGQGLLQLLIQPCQRIMRYKLLLKELLKLTENDHPDYADLVVAHDEVSAAAKKMNEGVREQQMSQKVAELVERKKDFIGFDSIVSPHRQLIHETNVEVPVGTKVFTWMLLFNDLLVFASDVMDGGKKKKKQVEQTIELEHLWFADMKDVSGSKDVTLQVISPVALFLVNCASKNEKQNWIKIGIQTVTKRYETLDGYDMNEDNDSRTFTYTFPEGEYKGCWRNGNPSGEGVFKYNTGNVYTGCFLKGKRHDKGRMTYVGGSYYDGSWENDQPHGPGVLELAGVGKYEGEWQKGRKHGKGRMEWSTGDSYEGGWVNDLMEGEGVLQVSGEQTRYEGSFKANKFHGKGMLSSYYGTYIGDWEADCREGRGAMTYSDMSVYEGTWKNDKRDGEGKYRMRDNKVTYEGEWNDDLMHGKGKLTYEGAFVYNGSLVNGRKHGEGELEMADGTRYKGGWADDRKEGQGDLEEPTGMHYEGQWHTDKRFGRGEQRYPDGSKYTGEWVKDLREGKGCLTLPDGSQYSGNWSSNKRHGRGVFHSAKDGAKYVGEWCKGYRSGKGTLTDKSGTYDGEWLQELRHGHGTFRCAVTKTIFTGAWKNDRRVGEGTLTLPDGTVVRHFYADGKLEQPELCIAPPTLPPTKTIFKK